MKAYSTLLSLFIIICCISACSKDNDKETPNEGTILKRSKMTYADTIVWHHIYERDAANKLIAMRDSTKKEQYTMKLEYGSNGKLAKLSFLQGNTSDAIFFYEFEHNADGRITKRKTRAGTLNVAEDYHVYEYDGAGHLVADTQYSTVDNFRFTLSFVSKYKYSGNNITEGEVHETVNGALQLSRRIKYEYDNGINPYKSLENEYFIRSNSTGIYEIYLMSENNKVRQLNAEGNDNYQEFQRYAYKYNSGNVAWKSWSLTVTPQQSKSEAEYFFQ